MESIEPGNDRPSDADASSVIASMAVGFVAIDRSWRMTRVNAAAGEILGAPPADLIGADVWSRFPGARELEFGPVLEAVMSTGRARSFEAWYPGLAAWFELRVQPTSDGIACYFLDITARRAADGLADESRERGRLIAEVTEALGTSLDIRVNAERLARLVVPRLGSWSIVTLADELNTLIDESSWHVDPDRRADVRRYADVRLRALPGTIAEQAFVTGQPAVITNGAHELIRNRLSDPEALALFDVLRPTAAAVLPMIARGRSIGVVSIYSDTAWTDHHVDTAREIADRAALSLDNSLAYSRARAARSDAEAARAEAVAAGRRVAFLAQVSEALAGTADADEAVGRLARLVVPELADWSLVTVLDDEHGLRDIGLAHRDPARTDEVAAYAARRSRSMTAQAPLATAMRTGEPYVVAEMSDRQLHDAQPDPSVADLVRRLEPHGLAVVPLVARGRVFGALTLVTTHARGPHTADEVAAAIEVGHRAAPVLESARSAQNTRRLAESIQRSMLSVPPARPGLDIVVRYRPAQVDNEVGGDWYDHFELPDGSTVLTIGDVMGHDTAAIAAMAQLRTFMRATAWSGRHAPSEVLADTDSASRRLGPGLFATAITGELGPAGTGGAATLRWSNAGHPPPAVVSADGTVSYLTTACTDPPLGVAPDLARHDHVTTLEPGTTLFLFTDGLIERRDRDVDTGLEELQRVLSSAGDGDLGPTVDKVLVEMTSRHPVADDIAVLAVRVRAG